MRTIYIDSDFRCHISNDGTMTAVETNEFDGKCDDYIEGFRFVPSGQTWVRDDGEKFTGMKTPWKPYEELESIQREYEREKLADAENALAIMFGGAV